MISLSKQRICTAYSIAQWCKHGRYGQPGRQRPYWLQKRSRPRPACSVRSKADPDQVPCPAKQWRLTASLPALDCPYPHTTTTRPAPVRRPSPPTPQWKDSGKWQLPPGARRSGPVRAIRIQPAVLLRFNSVYARRPTPQAVQAEDLTVVGDPHRLATISEPAAPGTGRWPLDPICFLLRNLNSPPSIGPCLSFARSPHPAAAPLPCTQGHCPLRGRLWHAHASVIHSPVYSEPPHGPQGIG
jgi:hypothetical protein